MKTSIFTSVDADSLQGHLDRIGATFQFERLEKVNVYDYPDLRLSKQGSWLRLRDEGQKVILSYRDKITPGENHHKSEEVDITLDNFNGMNFILEKVGLGLQFIEEKRRIRYKRDENTYTIELMPGIQPYLELTAPTEDALNEAAVELGLNPDDKKAFSTFQIYKEAGININEYTELTFAHLRKRQ